MLPAVVFCLWCQRESCWYRHADVSPFSHLLMKFRWHVFACSSFCKGGNYQQVNNSMFLPPSVPLCCSLTVGCGCTWRVPVTTFVQRHFICRNKSSNQCNGTQTFFNVLLIVDLSTMFVFLCHSWHSSILFQLTSLDSFEIALHLRSSLCKPAL